MSAATVTPSQAAQMVGVSLATIRGYTRREVLASYFSATARPGKGEARALTADDVRLCAFVADRTAQGLTYAQIAQAIEAGELEEFTHWTPEPSPEAEEEGENQAPEAAPLAQAPNLGELLERLTTAQIAALTPVFDDLRAEAERARERAAAAEAERAAAEKEAARLRGQLEEIHAARARRPVWLKWLVGG